MITRGHHAAGAGVTKKEEKKVMLLEAKNQGDQFVVIKNDHQGPSWPLVFSFRQHDKKSMFFSKNDGKVAIKKKNWQVEKVGRHQECCNAWLEAKNQKIYILKQKDIF